MRLSKPIFFIILSMFSFVACQNASKKEGNSNTKNNSETKNMAGSEESEKEISYTLVKNYFVKNTIEEIDNPVFATKEEFEEVFGMATTMGEGGKPTPIDFSEQYVIAVVLPETQTTTELKPVHLTQNEDDELTFTYKKEEGKEMEHTIKPALIVLVDKEYQNDVMVKEE